MCLVRIYKKVKQVVTRVVRALAHRVEQPVRRPWTSHGSRVRTDATYAAATAVVLSGLFGVVPIMDVVATVLAALFGVYAAGRTPVTAPPAT